MSPVLVGPSLAAPLPGVRIRDLSPCKGVHGAGFMPVLQRHCWGAVGARLSFPTPPAPPGCHQGGDLSQELQDTEKDVSWESRPWQPAGGGNPWQSEKPRYR